MAEIELSMGYMLNWGARLIRRLADRRLKKLGLSVAHLPIINALAVNEAMSQKALAAYAAIEQPTMAATLVRMERDRLVERRPDPHDKRSSLFSLTPATRKKLPAMRATIAAIDAEVLSGLPENVRKPFRRHLQATIATMEARVAAEAPPTGANPDEG
jgi:DNA-binding MarR family transcriptional regulator